jgi:hypothetical protein
MRENICRKMDQSEDHHIKQNKTGSERQISGFLSYVISRPKIYEYVHKLYINESNCGTVQGDREGERWEVTNIEVHFVYI